MRLTKAFGCVSQWMTLTCPSQSLTEPPLAAGPAHSLSEASFQPLARPHKELFISLEIILPLVARWVGSFRAPEHWLEKTMVQIVQAEIIRKTSLSKAAYYINLISTLLFLNPNSITAWSASSYCKVTFSSRSQSARLHPHRTLSVQCCTATLGSSKTNANSLQCKAL